MPSTWVWTYSPSVHCGNMPSEWMWTYSPPVHCSDMPSAWVWTYSPPVHHGDTPSAWVWTNSPPGHCGDTPSAWVCEPTHLQCPTVARPVHGCEPILCGVHLIDARALFDHRLKFPEHLRTSPHRDYSCTSCLFGLKIEQRQLKWIVYVLSCGLLPTARRGNVFRTSNVLVWIIPVFVCPRGGSLSGGGPPLGPFFFNFMQFSGECCQNNRLMHPLWG